MFKTLASGLSTLIEALATYANVKHAGVEAIERRGTGFGIACGGWVDGREQCDHRHARPPPRHPCSRASIPSSRGCWARSPYSSSAIVSLIFDESRFDGQRAGFGFLVPKRERDRLAACTFVATKFPHRAPDDRILLRCFFGGTADEAILSESDESLITIAREELRRILGLTAVPLFTNISRWPKSMAQYTVGHSVAHRGNQEAGRRHPRASPGRQCV